MGLFLGIYCMCVSVYMRLVFHWLLAHQRCSLLLKQHIPLSPSSPLSVITLSMCQCCCSVNKASVLCIPIPLLFPPAPNSCFSTTLTFPGRVSLYDSIFHCLHCRFFSNASSSFICPSLEAGERSLCGSDHFLVPVFPQLWDGRFLSCYQ